MKEFFINVIKILLSILIIVFCEEYFFKVMELIGLTISNTPFISLIIYLIEGIIIYIIYGKELRSAFSKYQDKFANNFLYSIISFIVLFVAMMIANYVLKLISNSVNITYHGLSYYNIFNESFSINTVISFIQNIIIIPFIKVSIFVLGINNLVKGKTGPLLSGIGYALYTAFLMSGDLSLIILNVIDEFILFMLLSYIYKKNDNITFSIITLVLYELLTGLLLVKLF